MKIIFCADDDRWKDGNPGITKAKAAAEKIGATVVIPKFKDLATKPTDFNDLHKLEGIDAVRQQLSEPKDEPKTCGITMLDLCEKEFPPVLWMLPEFSLRAVFTWQGRRNWVNQCSSPILSWPRRPMA